MQRIIGGSQRGVKRARGPCWEPLANTLRAQPELCSAAGPYVCRNLVAALMNAQRKNKESDLV